jgi:hypothetical protein
VPSLVCAILHGAARPQPVTLSVVAGPFCAPLIRSGATSILFVLFPQKLASLSIDEMYPSASFAGDCFVLVGRRVLIAVEPMLGLSSVLLGR